MPVHKKSGNLLKAPRKYLDLTRELKKTIEHAGDNNTNCNWCVWNSN